MLNYYPIETILAARKSETGGMMFYVKWYGYPDSDNSWVDHKDLYKGCPDLLDRLWENLGFDHRGFDRGEMRCPDDDWIEEEKCSFRRLQEELKQLEWMEGEEEEKTQDGAEEEEYVKTSKKRKHIEVESSSEEEPEEEPDEPSMPSEEEPDEPSRPSPIYTQEPSNLRGNERSISPSPSTSSLFSSHQYPKAAPRVERVRTKRDIKKASDPEKLEPHSKLAQMDPGNIPEIDFGIKTKKKLSKRSLVPTKPKDFVNPGRMRETVVEESQGRAEVQELLSSI